VSATILIVEDHDTVRRSLREWLEAVFPQHRFIEAASGEEAVAIAQARSPRVVVMDIALPQMNGIEATRRIKAAAPTAQVVMLTIHEDEAYRADAAAAGASAYVPKRLMQTELLPALEALLSGQEESEDADCETSELGEYVPSALRSRPARATGWNRSRGRTRRSCHNSRQSEVTHREH
jgi:DNA-binding NarL/FixJ family response regulator